MSPRWELAYLMVDPLLRNTPWGTWPETFGALLDERALLEQACAWLRLDQLGWLVIEGKDAASFQQGLLTADIRGLLQGRTREAFALDAQGKILFHIHVHRQGPTRFLLQTAADKVEALYRHLDKYLVMEQANLSLASGLGCLSLQGSQAAAQLEAIGGFAGAILSVDRCGFGGLDLVGDVTQLAALEAALEAAQTPRTGFAALELARTEHFLARFGVEMEEGNNPLIYGRGGDRIAYQKGCFIGQETVARTRDRGHPPKRLVQVVAEGEAVPSPGLELIHGGNACGSLSSAVYSSARAAVIGFAVIKYGDAVADATLTDPSGRSWRIVAISEY